MEEDIEHTHDVFAFFHQIRKILHGDQSADRTDDILFGNQSQNGSDCRLPGSESNRSKDPGKETSDVFEDRCSFSPIAKIMQAAFQR